MHHLGLYQGQHRAALLKVLLHRLELLLHGLIQYLALLWGCQLWPGDLHKTADTLLTDTWPLYGPVFVGSGR